MKGFFQQNILKKISFLTLTAFSLVGFSFALDANGVCGSAYGENSLVFPSTNLCASGTLFLPATTSGSLVTYTWQCLGTTSTASCFSFQTPTSDVCVPYTGGGGFDVTKAIFPTSSNAVMLNFNYGADTVLASDLKRQAETTNNGKIAQDNEEHITYTDASSYKLVGKINETVNVEVGFSATNSQFVPYKDTSVNGTHDNWYGCQASGWNISLKGIIPDQLLPYANTSQDRAKTSAGTANTTTITLASYEQIYKEIEWTDTQQQFLTYRNSENGKLMPWVSSMNTWIDISDPEQNFLAWKKTAGFTVDCKICTTTTADTKKTTACTGLPANAIADPATSITQYTGATGWFPSAVYSYNNSTTPNSKECKFVCKVGNHRDGTACISSTKIETCTGTLPANSTLMNVNTYISTRTGTTNTWFPVNAAYTYNTPLCGYTCNAGYHAEGTSCASNTKTASCLGSLPANATLTNGASYTSVRNGSSFAPSSLNLSPSATTCGYTCNSGYFVDGPNCTANPGNPSGGGGYSRSTGNWEACPKTYSRDVSAWTCDVQAVIVTAPTVDTNGICGVSDGTCSSGSPINDTGPVSCQSGQDRRWQCQGLVTTATCSARCDSVVPSESVSCASAYPLPTSNRSNTYGYAEYEGWGVQPFTSNDGCLVGIYSDISDDVYDRKRYCSEGGVSKECKAPKKKLTYLKCESWPGGNPGCDVSTGLL